LCAHGGFKAKGRATSLVDTVIRIGHEKGAEDIYGDVLADNHEDAQDVPDLGRSSRFMRPSTVPKHHFGDPENRTLRAAASLLLFALRAFCGRRGIAVCSSDYGEGVLAKGGRNDRPGKTQKKE
jgi:hypothetical protein